MSRCPKCHNRYCNADCPADPKAIETLAEETESEVEELKTRLSECEQRINDLERDNYEREQNETR